MYSEAVALLVTATNHCIWQTRAGQSNATPQDHNSKPVHHRIALAKIFTHISNREKKEKQRIDPTFIDIIQEPKQAGRYTTKPCLNRISVNVKT